MDSPPKRPRTVTFLLVGSVLIGGLTLLIGIVIALYMSAIGARRSDPVLIDTMKWRDGEVRVYDYCQHPGSFDCDVQWHGPDGKAITLVKAGNCTPGLAVGDDGLSITYRYRHIGWTVVFESPTRISKEYEAKGSKALPR